MEKQSKTDYKKYFKNGVVSGIIEAKVGGTGVQKLDFFMFLPILNIYLSKNSDLWKLYLLLRRIINFCYSTTVYEIDLGQFEYECKIFNRAFFNIFNQSRTPFKVHHIQHYAHAIKSFGPLFYLSTLRYERVHQLLGRLVRGSQNFTTLPKQIAMRWSLISLMNLSKPEITDDSIYECYEVAEIKDNVCSNLHGLINLSSELIVLNNAIVNDLEIKANQIYLIQYNQSTENLLPLFARICHIFKQNDQIKIVGKYLNAEQYFPTVDCSKVVEKEAFCEINCSSIKYHKDVQIIKTNFGLLISNCFYIPFQRVFSKESNSFLPFR